MKSQSGNPHSEPPSHLAPAGTPAVPVHPALLVLIVGAAFALYWSSSFVLEANKATTRFGADAWFYTELARGNVFGRLAENYHLDRIFRFHPVTVALGAGWMELFGVFARWLTPHQILKAMFAFIGALGVWAAMSAFAAVVLRRHVAFWGIIYAVSLSTWYFSSIEESKIVSATLAAIYIALYLHLRNHWTARRAILLTIVLLFACLNEIVAIFLIVIPAVDTFVRRRWDWRGYRWIALHGSVGPLSLAVLEWIARSRQGAAALHPESANHVSMLLWYVAKNDYGLASVYGYVLKWFLFSIAAPEPRVINPSVDGGDFQPSLFNYFSNAPSAAAIVLLAALLLIVLWPRFRPASLAPFNAVLCGLAAYALLRSLFFFFLLPKEGLLFTPSIVLTHLLLLAIPFSASEFPRRRVLLALFATALFLANGAFMIAP